MNVLEADSGSWENETTACCAATKALVVFMVRSRLNLSSGIVKGSSVSQIAVEEARVIHAQRDA